MKVKLISKTENAEQVVHQACCVCTQADEPDYSKLTDKQIHKLIKNVIDSGHLSVLEHVSMSFSIDEVSRALSHQLVRHRIASYSQQSQRYITLTIGQHEYYATPNTIADHPDSTIVADYACLMDYIQSVYNKMIDSGIPAEDARFVLPNATKTKLVMTMNVRELRHFLSLRLCERAQWEIKELAEAIYALAIKEAPTLFYKAGPGCVTGKCPESKLSCGKPWRKL